MSLRDTILQADDLEEQTMTIPEWDGAQILLRSMTGAERIDVAKLLGADDSYAYADVLIMLALDPETRKPIFEPADREALAGKSGAVLERIASELNRLSFTSSQELEDQIESDPTSAGA